MIHHVMLDLETWGTAPYSTIIMIGACEFNPYTEWEKEIITDRFEVAIKPTNTGLRVDADTLMWWMDPERDIARRAWSDMHKVYLNEALDGFSDWLHSMLSDSRDEQLRIWGNGAGFDNTLLRQAYEITQRECPWNFRDDRCFRTLRNLAEIEDPGPAHVTEHTALADAESQAIRANQMVRRLGIKLT